MQDIVITGGSGFVGSNLVDFFSPSRNLGIIDIKSPIVCANTVSWINADIRNEDAVFSAITTLHPRYVIHAAGVKNVKYCEEHPDEAYQVNAIGTRNVAQACKKIGAKMLHISTDRVFTGDTGNYRECDKPKSKSVYGKTKLKGEELAIDILDDVAICRSGGIYGQRSPLLCWLKRQLDSSKVVECFNNVYNSPTYVVNFAEHLAFIIENDLTGLFHIVGRERVNRYQLFSSFARIFELDINLLRPVAGGNNIKELFLVPDCSLSIDKTISMLDGVFNSVEEGLTRLKTEFGGLICND